MDGIDDLKMNKLEDMSDKGDLYVQRLRDRQLDSNRSPDCYSKSFRRRLSIMEAICKSNISPPAESNYSGNPFEREFSGSSLRSVNCDGLSPLEIRFPSACSSDWTQDSIAGTSTSEGTRTYRVEIMPTVTNTSIETTSPPAVDEYDNSPTDNNSNSIEYRHSSQFHQEYLSEVPEERESEPGSLNSEQKNPLEIPSESRLSRMSIGEYFSAASHQGMTTQNFLGQIYSKDLEQSQPEHPDDVGPNMLFSARVLEIIEPQVVQAERQSTAPNHQRHASQVTMLRERFEELNSNANDTIATSLISENIRELEREVEALQIHPEVERAFGRARTSTQLITQQIMTQVTPQRQEEILVNSPPVKAPLVNTPPVKSPLVNSPPVKSPVVNSSPVKSPLVNSPPMKSAQVIAETPKRLYPDLELRRLSDKFTSRKLFHANEPNTAVYSNTGEAFAEDELKRNGMEKPTAPERESLFRTNNLAQTKSQDNGHQDASTSSFIKRNMSFVVGHLPKFGRHHKPNLESTRKASHSENKTTSPFSQGSLISTLTLPNSPPNQANSGRQNQLQSINVHAERMEGTLPFEVENFLEMALGDEQYNSTVTFDHPDLRDKTNSQLNASELLSYDRTPITARFTRISRVPMSEPPKHSTLNRTMSFYKTLTQRIKKKFRGSIKDDEIRPLDRTILPLDMNTLDDSVKRLLNVVEIQQTYIYQSSKALDLCASMPEFSGSRERVESERQLLLANLRKAAAVDEIHRLARQRSEDRPCSERAEVLVRSLSLQLRDDVLRRDRQSGNLVEWFVVVINEGPFVWATEAIPTPENGSRLYFDGDLSIPNMTPNFRVTLRVYSLKLQQILFNHEDKYHIPTRREDNSDMASTTCPSPNKLLRRASIKRRSFASSRQFDIRFSGIRESAFSLCGTVELMLHDLNLSPPWPLISVPAKSVLRGTVDLSLTHRLQLAASHTGFLTFGEEVAGLAVWNRRWCVLENHRLLFWNYTSEQDNKNPICIIDLTYCVSPRISLIDRSLCAKPRTLLIETARRRDGIDRESMIIENRTTRAIVRNLLSFDNNQDLMEWQSKLNYVVTALREWNMIVN